MLARALRKTLPLFSLLFFTNIQSVHAAPPPEAFGQLPLAYDAAISPDGKNIAIFYNNKGIYGVFIRPLMGSKEDSKFVTLGEGVSPKYLKWVSDTRWVASIKKQEEHRGTPFTTSFLYTSDIETGGGKFVIRPKVFRQFNDVVIDWLEDDPEHILMSFSEESFDAYPDIKKVHVATGNHKTVKRGINGIEYWTTDDNGVPRIGTGRYEGSGKRRMTIYNTETDKWESDEKYPGLEADSRIYGMLKDGTEIVLADYQGKDTLGLYIYDLKQKKITRKLFHNDKYDASGVVLSKDGESVIGAKYVADKDKIELIDGNGTLLDELRGKLKDYNVDFIDQTQDGKTVIVRVSSPYDPGGFYVYSRGDNNPSPLTKLYESVTGSDLGNVISTRYTARDGQKIPAFVTLPIAVEKTGNIKNIPFIVLPHGGPYGRDAKDFDYFAQFFATRGYGVLQMNFRGSDGYGKSFEEAGRSNWVVMQEDVEDGMRWLLEKGYADPDRTCIAGWSYGGYAALMGVAKDPDLYKCAIAMAALTDINGAKSDLRKYRHGKNAAKEFFGDAMQDSAVRKANSPVHVADNIKVPVFLAHGDIDENVQFSQFTRMKKALKKAKVDSTFMQFKDENHYLETQKNREAFFVGMDKFLKEVNGTSEYMTH